MQPARSAAQPATTAGQSQRRRACFVSVIAHWHGTDPPPHARRRLLAIADEPIAAVGSNKLGLAGACYGLPSGSRGGSGIGFALVGPDGAPRGQPVAVVESTFRGDIVSCAVGSDEGGFLVAWWNGTELWVRRVDVAR